MLDYVDYVELMDSRLTDQFRNDKAIRALVKTIADVANYYQTSYIEFFNNYLDIDEMFGSILDLIGRIAGQPRILVNYTDAPYFGFEGSLNGQTFGTVEDPAVGGYWYSITNPNEASSRILTDEEYKIVLKSRIIKNSSNSSTEDILKVLNLLTGNQSTQITYPLNGYAEVTVNDPNGLASYFLSRYQYPDTILPIPNGTRLKVNYL